MSSLLDYLEQPMSDMKSCPKCGGAAILCEPNYADESVLVICSDCDHTSCSFTFGEFREGVDSAIDDWNSEPSFNPRQSEGYRLVKEFYGDRRAARSQVLLMDHIHQGIEILQRLGANPTTIEAYVVHPIFQADPELAAHVELCRGLDPMVVLLAMEYRNIANHFLSPKVRMNKWGPEAVEEIKLSPLSSVNEMLVADKVQNRKDFLAFHEGIHERTLELDYYFKYWLEALQITEEMYEELVKGL